eukprot:snap_masked-scaffold_9-processed-gene-9.14-mRNA-1 protein AED:1.00 eAED:1.00 QI:0/-1/0/0/-1/1/1/0/70
MKLTVLPVCDSNPSRSNSPFTPLHRDPESAFTLHNKFKVVALTITKSFSFALKNLVTINLYKISHFSFVC